MEGTQIQGLNRWATNLVLATEQVQEAGTRFWSDGRHEEFSRTVNVPTVSSRENGKINGIFGEEYSLREYTLKDGRVFQEYIQAAYWSGNPVIFLALKELKNKFLAFPCKEVWQIIPESLWTDKEIPRI